MIRAGLFGKDGTSAGGSSGAAVALLGVDVRAEILGGHASAVVRQRYRNDEAKPIEAVYTFPLPSKAALTGFSMTVDGRRLEGEVHEREEAFRRYDDAITAGHGSALLEQERPNVFTANVGNLLPGEETIIELHYVEPLLADEGAVRWSIPTLVAPRYIPGVPTGDRTAHGVADPTDRVPDADRISPPIGAVAYGLKLDLTFDLGVAVEVESPSHALVVRHEGQKAHVSFSQREVPLDRDIVVTAFARATTADAGRTPAPIASAVSHRMGGKGAVGAFALTVIPDLGAGQSKSPKGGAGTQDVVFVLDRSGSMGGASMPEARTALRLCLRQLREGARFNILAFDDTIESFAPSMVPFTQATLQRADHWLAGVEARGGTELLAPMLEAVRLAPDGIIVVLTDGEVGNEDEILRAFMGARDAARVYSFAIGTNVSDALLHSLADKTGGAVEMIYPGERLDEKVVAQFARATAPRVTDVTIKTRGVELEELAPAEPRPLIDSEPYCLFGTYEQAGPCVVEIRGKLGGESFYLEVPLDLAEERDQPVVVKLWAQARIRDLERAIVTGRRADAMKDRIVKLAVQHGVSSKYTSFVVVEKRTGDRRATAQPETRVVPVNSPAGWAMFQGQQGVPPTAQRMRAMSLKMPLHSPASMPMGRLPAPRPAAGMPPPARAAAPPPMAPPAAGRGGGGYGGSSPTGRAPPMPPRLDSYDAGASMDRFAESEEDEPRTLARGTSYASPAIAGTGTGAFSVPEPVGDPVLDVLSRQAASGLWEEAGRDPVAATVDALLALLRLGLSTAHPIHGAQLKKAVDALLVAIQTRGTNQGAPVGARLLELAFGVAWLLATGRRTRHEIEGAARGDATLGALASTLGNELAVRAHVDRLASA